MAIKRCQTKYRNFNILICNNLQSELNIETLLKVDNIIFALARDISGNNPIAQLGATNCCCNIALGNTRACTAIAKHVSPYIVTECESLNRPLLVR